MRGLRTICFAAGVLFLCAYPALGTIEFKDGLTHDINYEIDDTVYVDYQTPARYTTINWLDGGRIEQPYSLFGFEDSRINVLGGYIDRLHVSSIVTVNNGSVNYIAAADNSTLNVTGGKIKGISTYNTSTTIISNGLISNNIQTHNSSEVTISGGTINNYVHAYDNSIITISGGVTNNAIISHDSGIIDIMGGTINSSFQAYDGTIYLYGSNFSVNSTALSFGDDLRDYGTLGSGGLWLSGPITGILQDGSVLDTYFSVWADSDAQIIIIPEPATVLLLGLGMLFLRKRQEGR
jgi:hypothetical protein